MKPSSQLFDLKTTDDGDIQLDGVNGSFSTVTGVQELAQKVGHLLSINSGEIKWNRDLGINQQEILLNGASPTLVNAIVNRYLKQVFGRYFNTCHVIGTIKHPDERAVDLNMTVVFNNPDGAPLHIDTSLEVGGDN